MLSLRSMAAGLGLTVALACVGGCAPAAEAEAQQVSLMARVRTLLAGEAADSDAAVILTRGLAQAESAAATEAAGILSRALERAEEARRFAPVLATPLPPGWPRPSVPELIRFKTYPGDAVTTENAEPLKVVSIGVVGAATEEEQLPATVARLRVWVRNDKRWWVAGEPRALAYHPPSTPLAERYSEVQIPVEPNDQRRADTATDEVIPPLTAAERRIILAKGTERAFSGKYWDHHEAGTYLCRQCGAALFPSEAKFDSKTGWPSFDTDVPGSVKRVSDADGFRTEIVCAACDGHLGHVFEGEGMTPKNTRHCVNSASLMFRSVGQEPAAATQEAIFAGGCFWGVEHHFDRTAGVISATSGYTGGEVANPTYEQICTGQTGHAEAVRIVFDPKRTTYEQLARLFFETHDPTQLNRQGPDRGTQYRSALFYADDQQKQTAEKLVALLRANGYDVVTQIVPKVEFYEAEDYHQDYLTKHPGRPTCHLRRRRFDAPNN